MCAADGLRLSSQLLPRSNHQEENRKTEALNFKFWLKIIPYCNNLEFCSFRTEEGSMVKLKSSCFCCIVTQQHALAFSKKVPDAATNSTTVVVSTCLNRPANGTLLASTRIQNFALDKRSRLRQESTTILSY